MKSDFMKNYVSLKKKKRLRTFYRIFYSIYSWLEKKLQTNICLCIVMSPPEEYIYTYIQ